MATFFMFGKYSQQGMEGITAGRTAKAKQVIGKLGGKVQSMHILLGVYDLVIVADLPDTAAAIKASVALTKLTGIGFSTAPAIPVAQFDKLVAG